MSTKEGWVYVLRERDFLTGKTDRYVKIGLTKNEVELRNKDHQTGNPRLIYSEYEQHVPLMSTMETYLHHVHSSDRIHGEWFDLDETRVTNELIPLIKRIAVEQAETKTHMELVSQLKTQHDSGKERVPTPTETALHAAYLDAKHAFESAKARHAIHDSAIRAMIGASGGIEGVVTVNPKPQGALFNKKSFVALLTEAELATCHETVTEFKSAVKISGTKTLKSLNSTLAAEKKSALDAITNPATTANLGQPLATRKAAAQQAHADFLSSRRTVKETEWAEIRAKNALMAALGKDRAITGVIEWTRGDVTTEHKWNAALAKERFPEQHAKAMLDRDDTVDVNIADGHPY